MNDVFGLSGKVAVITGAASGLGRAAVELFCEQGATVVIADVNEEAGQRLEAILGGKATFCHCDVRSESSIATTLRYAAERHGGLDIVYHNAGSGGDRANVEQITVEGWDEAQNLLLRSSMLCVKHAVPWMKSRGGGSIILTSSAAGVAVGGPAPYAYSVAKAAVLALCRFAAVELGEHLIRVNALVPGAFRTGIWDARLAAADAAEETAILAQFARMQPLSRRGELPDVAAAALFLASDASAFVTGVTLPVDGGLTLLRKPASTELRGRGAPAQGVAP